MRDRLRKLGICFTFYLLKTFYVVLGRDSTTDYLTYLQNLPNLCKLERVFDTITY